MEGEGALFRRCTRCGLWMAQPESHKSRTGQFSYCSACRREYDRQYYRERGKTARRLRQRERVRQARLWMAALKEGIPCTDCGGVYPVWVMHWDHLPGFDKVDAISSLVSSRSRTITLAELQKCELVCANCHVLRTTGRAGCSAAR